MADSRWLRTFNENLERVKKTKGFVLQIQQGVLRERSDMQVAEEMQSGWLQVPRIGYFAFPVTDVRGGGTLVEELMDKAIAAARAQWTNGVSPNVEMIAAIYEPLEGELRFDAWGEVEGPARCTLPNGNVYEVNFKHGLKHGRGTAKSADGATFTGQWENDKMHGQGTYAWANGTVEVGFYEKGEPKGPGVVLDRASGRFLLKDGQTQQLISQAEAG